MKHSPASFVLPLLFVSLIAAPCARSAEPRAGYHRAEIDRDLAWLDDTHASSSVKAAAASRLGELTRDNAAFPHAIQSLHRQSFYDAPYVRQAARNSLVRMLGPAVAEKVLNSPPPGTEPDEAQRAVAILLDPFSPEPAQIEARGQLIHVTVDVGTPLTPLIQQATQASARGRHARIMLGWILGVREADVLLKVGPLRNGESLAAMAQKKIVEPITNWDQFDRAMELTRSSREAFQDIGVEMIRRMIYTSAGPATPEYLRRYLLATQALGRKPRLAGAEGDRITLVALTASASFTSSGVTKCLAHWNDSIPAVQKAARNYWDSMVVNGKLNDDAARVLGNFVLTFTEPARERLLSHLDKASPSARANAHAMLLTSIVSNDERAGQSEIILERWKLEHAPLAEAARTVASVHAGYQPELRSWFLDAISHPEAAADSLAMHLGLDSEDLRVDAARIAMLAPTELKPTEALLEISEMGRRQSRKVILVIAPDTSKIRDRLIALLAASTSQVRLAALDIMATVGVTDDLLRHALEPFLRSTRTEERHLAMEALGTDDAKRIALAPELLVKLRSRDPRIRSQAAHDARRLEIDKPRIMTALVLAVDAGDMAAREGLVLALERASKSGEPAGDILAKADDEKDLTLRAYLKAGKRAAAAR